MERILVINPGATSTKYAVFDGETAIVKETLEHHENDLKYFAHVTDQHDFRLDLILKALERSKIQLGTVNAVAARGGLLKPLEGGTYTVDGLMVEDLKRAEWGEHSSNLGAIIAYSLSLKLGIPAFIVDPVSVDEMEPEARISGLPELPRVSLFHALNSRAVARKAADDMGKRYEDVNLVVAHLGTGISLSSHRKGRIIDMSSAQDEGPFSPDRCGGLPVTSLIRLCYSGKYNKEEMLKRVMGKGGLYAYLNTRDIREAEKMADEGDSTANTVLSAMSYQIAKAIGGLSATLSGEVDRIIITGGIAHSKRIVDSIISRVSFIAPVVVIPGEEELEALAAGVLRVLRGEESPKIY